MNAHAEAKQHVPALVAGGHVGAIIPQSIEEIWRVSTMVVRAGLAPAALVNNKAGDAAASAVATAIMAGAELGLPPMVALRSFTVIGGRPALYGDGLINVVRRSRRAEYVRTGYDKATETGWCEAKRSDTGEESRVEFSKDDAKRAGLWDDREKVTRYKKGGQGTYQADNDSPWHRYPQRMLSWRAAGYCLRELFADVLGGITDEYEAREIAGYEPEMRDVSPRQSIAAPPPPPEPEDTVDEEQADPPAPPAEDDDRGEAPEETPAELLERAEQWFANSATVEDLEVAWSDFEHEIESLSDEDGQKLKRLYAARLQQLEPNPLGGG